MMSKRLRALAGTFKRFLQRIGRLLGLPFREGADITAACYLNYVKNKFLARHMLTRVPVWSHDARHDVEVHVLLRKADVWPLMWTLRSFLYHSGLFPTIVIHDDGSLDGTTADVLTATFRGLRVIRRVDADRLMAARLTHEPTRRYRTHGHPLILKLIDVLLLGTASKIVVLDSDVLFYNRPTDIIDFVRAPSDVQALILCAGPHKPLPLKVTQGYLERHQIDATRVSTMNSGIIVFDRAAISEDMLSAYFDNCERQASDYFVEMAGWLCLIAQTRYRALPIGQYVVRGTLTEATVAKHFIGAIREELFAYGLDRARERLVASYWGSATG